MILSSFFETIGGFNTLFKIVFTCYFGDKSLKIYVVVLPHRFQVFKLNQPKTATLSFLGPPQEFDTNTNIVTYQNQCVELKFELYIQSTGVRVYFYRMSAALDP